MVVDQINNNSKSHLSRSFSPNMYDRIKLRKREGTVKNPALKLNGWGRSQISKKPKSLKIPHITLISDLPIKKCGISVTKIDVSKYLKNMKTNSKSIRKVQNNVESSTFLKPNPKTIKDFQNNDKILVDFSKDHSDDMFDYDKAPNYVSQMSLLENSFSDQDSTPGTAPSTPVTDFVSRFDSWSVETPIHLRIEEEEENQTLGQFNHCAFLRKAINEKKKPKKLSLTFPGASAQSSSKSFSSCLAQIKPALDKITSSSQMESEDEMEDYFEESEGQS